MINNPVLKKEMLRLLLRQSSTTRIGLLTALVLPIGLLYWKIFQWLLEDASPGSGHSAWMAVVCIQFAVIVLVAPSITANAITQEREQQTWEMLIFTRLLPGEIILGKLLARMVSVLLILALFFPLTLFAWLHAPHLGDPSTSVSVGQFLGAYIVILLTALFYATFGLFMSWLFKRTIYALIMSYTFVIGGLVIGTALVTYVISLLFMDTGWLTTNKFPLLWVNPILLIQVSVAPDSQADTPYLIYGLLCYAVLTVLMLWRMIAGFRRFAYE